MERNIPFPSFLWKIKKLGGVGLGLGIVRKFPLELTPSPGLSPGMSIVGVLL